MLDYSGPPRVLWWPVISVRSAKTGGPGASGEERTDWEFVDLCRGRSRQTVTPVPQRCGGGRGQEGCGQRTR